MDSNNENDYFKGRGAQINYQNRFLKQTYVTEHIEGLDEPLLENSSTEYYEDHPKKILNKSESPDLPFMLSLNPYQGCEHGCIYCYARNAHEYYGFSAGLDFERKIIIKKNAAELLEKSFQHKKWVPHVVMLSGNTDCYQPVERKLKITRSLLEIFLKYGNPVSIITKNSLIIRDTDILSELAKKNLVHVNVSINSVREKIRQMLEPRTATLANRFKVINELSKNGVPCSVMNAPIIPGLTVEDIPHVIKRAAENGATGAGYTIVRLNGAIGPIFTDWVYKAFPLTADKIINQIKACHGGKLNDSRWGTRMSGDGNVAESIHQLFNISVKKYMGERERTSLSLDQFKNVNETQLKLF
jgi:DNA repair photolyase